MSKKQLTTEQRIEIGKRLVEGESPQDLADEFNTSESNVYVIKNRYLSGYFSVKPDKGDVIAVSSEKLKDDIKKVAAKDAYIKKLESMVCKLTFELQELKGI